MEEQAESAKELIQMYADQLMVLAASDNSNRVTEDGHILRQDEWLPQKIRELLDEYAEQIITRFLAEHMIESPEDCIDDYDTDTEQ